MLKRMLALAAGGMALTGMQAPTAPPPPRGAEIELWRLDCGDVAFTDLNAFFSDTSRISGRAEEAGRRAAI